MSGCDRSPVWIGLCDLALAVLAVALVAVNPPVPKAKGVETKAEILATVEWDVNTDADVDIHMRTPSGRPVFYGSRDVGCATLDRDSRGFLDNVVTLVDGTQTKVESDEETIAIRCLEPGRYDLAVNLYEYRENHLSVGTKRGLGLKVHVEIVKLNPQVSVLYAGDVTLDHVGQTVNWVSFDLAREGKVTLADPPLAPVTAAYQTARP